MSRLGNLRFWQKVLAALLVVGILPIALVGVVSVQRTRDQLTKLGVTNVHERSTSTGNGIDAYLEARLGDIIVVSRLPDVIRYALTPTDATARSAARDALRAAADRAPEYESVAVVDLDGTITNASAPGDEGTNVKFREYFLKARDGTTYISDPSYSVITNRPALFFSAPIKNAAGTIIAVARTRVNLAAIWDLVEADAGSVGEGSHGFLVDDYGIRIAVSETKGQRDKADSLIYKPIARIDPDTVKKLAADKRFGQLTPDRLIVDPLPALRTELDTLRNTGGTIGGFASGTGNAEQRAVVIRLQQKPWAYVLAVPISTYTKAADDSTVDALAVLLIAIVLSVAAGIWLTGSLVRPLRRLVAQATRVSTGSVDFHVAHFETHVGDDITRDVAAAFDRLLNALRFYAANQYSEPERYALPREADAPPAIFKVK